MYALALIAALATTTGISSRPPRVKPPGDPVLKAHLQGKTVLALGDSMIVTGLEIWLRQVVRKHGGKLKRWSWASSTTRKWATTGALRRALRKHRPDVVIIVLGSNELYLDHPEKRARYVKAMLRRIEPRPYRWLGPPVWNTQTGIVDMLEKTVPEGRFYRFNGRKIGRHKDGRHPSVYGSRTWTHDFVRWWIKRLKAEKAGAP
jgi:hypothetical protein